MSASSETMRFRGANYLLQGIAAARNTHVFAVTFIAEYVRIDCEIGQSLVVVIADTGGI